ncbi:MAG: mechanosensitive ion channel [Acidobacteria bacterium]|nr:mechanosensitive ion channel [Acidobacteriota bacterium]
MDNLMAYKQKFIEMAMKYTPKLLLAILTLIIGLWIIRILTRLLEKGLTKSKVDESLHHFLNSGADILLKILLLISVASMVGIQTTSFIALIGAAGFAVGMALQGSLANFAGGILILLFKPFKVGDFIEAQGQSGIVRQIQIFNTVLNTLDNKRVVIPNGNLSNGNIINHFAEPFRRVDWTFGIGYNDDLKKAKEILSGIIANDAHTLKDPKPLVAVAELADSSINFTVRAWCKTEDYWEFFFDIQEKVKLTFDREGISIPYPQTDVHLYQG